MIFPKIPFPPHLQLLDGPFDLSTKKTPLSHPSADGDSKATSIYADDPLKTPFASNPDLDLQIGNQWDALVPVGDDGPSVADLRAFHRHGAVVVAVDGVVAAAVALEDDRRQLLALEADRSGNVCP